MVGAKDDKYAGELSGQLQERQEQLAKMQREASESQARQSEAEAEWNPGFGESAHFCLFLGRRVALGGVPEVRVLADPELLALRVPVVTARPLPPALLVICTTAAALVRTAGMRS